MGLYDPDSEKANLDSAIQNSAVPEPMSAPQVAPQEGLGVQGYAGLIKHTLEKFSWPITLTHSGLPDYTKSDPNYNPWDHIKDTNYANHPEYFKNVDNEEELQKAMKLVDEHEDYLRLASRAPNTAFWAALGAGVVDPLLAIPGFGMIKAARVGKAISATRTAATTGIVTGGILGAEEAVLQPANPERTGTEAALTVTAGAVVNAAIGFGVGYKALKAEQATAEAVKQAPIVQGLKAQLAVTEDVIPADPKAAMANLQGDNYVPLAQRIESTETPTIKGELQPEITDEELAAALAPKGTDGTQSAGAAFVTRDARIKGLHPAIIKAIAVPHAMPPSLEAMASDFATLRDLQTRLGYVHYPIGEASESGFAPLAKYQKAVNPETFTGEVRQIAPPISLESRMQQDMLIALDMNKELDRLYLQFSRIDPDSVGAVTKARIQGMFGKTIKQSDFETMVMDAIAAGDRHTIPEVEQAAKYLSNLFKERFKAAQDVGVFEKDAVPIKNYFKVVYDMPKIIKYKENFEQAVMKVILQRQPVEVVVERNGKQVIEEALYHPQTKTIDWVAKDGEKLVEIRNKHEVLDTLTAQEHASDITDNILRMGDNSLALGDLDRLNFTRGTDHGKPRKLVLTEKDYKVLKPWLVKNLRDVTHSYLASMSRAINWKKTLDDLGVDKIQDLRTRLRDEGKQWQHTIRNIPEKSPEELAKLDRAERKKYMTPEQKAKYIAKINKKIAAAEALMNDVISIYLGQFRKRTPQDALWRTVNQYNVSRLFGGIVLASVPDAVSSTIKNWLPNTIWNGWLAGLKHLASGTSTLKKQDYRNALTAIYSEMDDIARELMYPEAGHLSKGRIEQAATAGSSILMKGQGMVAWNSFWQRAAHNLAEQNILRWIKDLSKKSNVSELTELGITPDLATRISAMQKKHGVDRGLSHISNTHKWEDRAAADAFNNAIRTDVHKSPLITELGDIARFYQKTEFRKHLATGKGFTFGAVTKLAVSAAARHDSRAMQGIILLTMAGMVTAAIQGALLGRAMPESLPEWIAVGADRSGVLGMLGDPFFQIGRQYSNVKQWGGRAWTQDPIDYILGPSASIIDPIKNGIMSKIAGQPIDKKTEYRLKSLIPYRNLWLFNTGGKDK